MGIFLGVAIRGAIKESKVESERNHWVDSLRNAIRNDTLAIRAPKASIDTASYGWDNNDSSKFSSKGWFYSTDSAIMMARYRYVTKDELTAFWNAVYGMDTVHTFRGEGLWVKTTDPNPQWNGSNIIIDTAFEYCNYPEHFKETKTTVLDVLKEFAKWAVIATFVLFFSYFLFKY